MSIWKTGNLQKADTRKQILFFAGNGHFLYLGWNHPALGMILAGSADWKYGDIQKWCYVDDLIAQADKAERLQKAVDLAIETLKFYADGRHYKDEELDLSVYEWYEKEEMGVLILDDGGRIENGKKARDAIKQLIKGEIDDK